MRTQIHIQAFPRTAQQWKHTALYIVLFAVVAQLIINAFKMGLHVPDTLPWWQPWVLSLLYTSIIIMTQLFTGEMVNRLLPLRSKLAAVLHVFIQAVSAVGALLLARQCEILLFGFCNLHSDMMMIISVVAMILSLIGNTGYYLFALYRQLRAAEQAALESELKALRAQINPHFLFNALNSIAALIRIRPDEAEQVTEQLADLFRYSLRASKTPLVTLEEEMESVQMYLSIELTRFRDRLCVRIDVPEHLFDAAVPSLLLQPLVENAIKHGANIVEGNFLIEILAAEREGTIAISVRDSGNGFNLSLGEDLFAKGTGLANVRDRLLLLFPNTGAMQIESHGITLRFPHQPVTETAYKPLAKGSVAL